MIIRSVLSNPYHSGRKLFKLRITSDSAAADSSAEEEEGVAAGRLVLEREKPRRGKGKEKGRAPRDIPREGCISPGEAEGGNSCSSSSGILDGFETGFGSLATNWN